MMAASGGTTSSVSCYILLQNINSECVVYEMFNIMFGYNKSLHKNEVSPKEDDVTKPLARVASVLPSSHQLLLYWEAGRQAIYYFVCGTIMSTIALILLNVQCHHILLKNLKEKWKNWKPK